MSYANKEHGYPPWKQKVQELIGCILEAGDRRSGVSMTELKTSIQDAEKEAEELGLENLVLLGDFCIYGDRLETDEELAERVLPRKIREQRRLETDIAIQELYLLELEKKLEAVKNEPEEEKQTVKLESKDVLMLDYCENCDTRGKRLDFEKIAMAQYVYCTKCSLMIKSRVWPLDGSVKFVIVDKNYTISI